ncbi:tRNA pseudouridine(13) synthase TruD [candidate division WOR-3 bacterium]|uniref:tRNA pseudouridine(13) synthase TruD n=1 Tax=candidate division WOR-3 bacterium TaxID=2052148 RepID=A0A938BP73_UNCW3|nr:tRNA pseudouridine(13) synthase TruD [candidate division WOR-3 bacterium]
MKLKARPEDFRVEERLRLRLKRAGAHSVYRLEKRFWNTLDVITHLEQRHGLRKLSRAGLKDRYALSVQYLSLPGRGPKQVVEKNYTLRLAGMADEPVSRDVLLGNSFKVTLRALTDDEASAILSALPKVNRFGFPNYYDEQRLGSARHGQGFIARRLIAGHFNGALRLWLGTPSSADDTQTRRRKSAIEDNWGNWRRLLELAPPEGQPAIRHLSISPKDFKGAVYLIPRQLLELFVNAYQAWLWNEILAALLADLKAPLRQLEYFLGSLAFYDELNPTDAKFLSKLVVPAPGPDAEFASERAARVTNQVLAREGLSLDQLELKLRIRGVFFKAYPRKAVVLPENMRATAPEADDLYPGRKKLVLSFFLPPGSYATMLIKRLSLL